MAIVPPRSIRRVLLATLVLGALYCTGAAIAGARTIGIVPPKNPKHNCAGSHNDANWNLAGINRCRASEGVGRLRLPTNWSSLTVPQRLLVVIDLERVNRGLAPVVGLSSTLNSFAQAGANHRSDPGFPSRGFTYAGSIWAGVGSVLAADYGWMYADGTGGSNLDCTSAHAKGCWEHRDIILMRHGSGIVGGGGYKRQHGQGSYAFEMLAAYSQKHLTFTWKSELKHFKTRPGLEPLK